VFLEPGLAENARHWTTASWKSARDAAGTRAGGDCRRDPLDADRARILTFLTIMTIMTIMIQQWTTR
jgi:hypothetical protein